MRAGSVGWRLARTWPSHRHWRSFEEARAFVRKLGLKSTSKMEAYCRSGKKPNDIPAAPYGVYADRVERFGRLAWNGRPDGGWRPLRKLALLCEALDLKSSARWKAYCRSGKKPDDIPTKSRTVYADAVGLECADWLGIDRPQALAALRGSTHFRAKSWTEVFANGCLLPLWKKAKRYSGYPANSLCRCGWNRMGDWLGTGPPRQLAAL